MAKSVLGLALSGFFISLGIYFYLLIESFWFEYET